ncbi:MAG: flagellar basal-body MS-ring/collar protein FliF [Methylophilaceae bacterium]
MAQDATIHNGVPGLLPQQIGSKLFLLAGIAAVIAVMVVFWLWSQQPDYRVLFSNFTDKDGGAIVAALDKMNVPYKLSDSGTAIMVPAAQVHQARLKLASEGLPKGGNIGFELLEKQKFGVSQFVEQVNFQRGLEGELERSIQAIDTVESAIIHLAIPKQSVFVRDQQKPTASVLLNVLPGRHLDANQVSAVVHLVASSVPNLPTANVTVVDQNGNLLSDTAKKPGAQNLDPAQLKYVDELQQNIARRVESIIAPIVGTGNVRAEASVEVDFTTTEQAAEIYKPNQNTTDVAVRSMQSNESQVVDGAGATGVPGALSNQPPEDATAPIVAEEGEATTAAATVTPVKSQKNTTTNFEVDKTVRYVQQAMGGVKRINVAVVVNNMPVVDAEGKTTYRPLTDAEKQQINDLARQAMGFNQERGDALAVVNSVFAQAAVEPLPEVPVWQSATTIEYVKDALRFIVGIVAMFLLYKKVLKPMFNKLAEPLAIVSNQQQAIATLNSGNGETVLEGNPQQISRYNQSLDSAKQIAAENPRMVASVVSGWTSGASK